jgi:small subunit ribosomal protein S21
MIIVDVKEGEALDKALRRFKKKFEKLGILKQVRKRAYYTPPSVRKKIETKKAVGRQRYIQSHSDEL